MPDETPSCDAAACVHATWRKMSWKCMFQRHEVDWVTGELEHRKIIIFWRESQL